jgi:hypothetical protein
MGRIKISKTAQNAFKHPEKKFSFKASGFLKFPKPLSRNEIFSVYVICPKFPNC